MGSRAHLGSITAHTWKPVRSWAFQKLMPYFLRPSCVVVLAITQKASATRCLISGLRVRHSRRTRGLFVNGGNGPFEADLDPKDAELAVVFPDDPCIACQG